MVLKGFHVTSGALRFVSHLVWRHINSHTSELVAAIILPCDPRQLPILRERATPAVYGALQQTIELHTLIHTTGLKMKIQTVFVIGLVILLVVVCIEGKKKKKPPKHGGGSSPTGPRDPSIGHHHPGKKPKRPPGGRSTRPTHAYPEGIESMLPSSGGSTLTHSGTDHVHEHGSDPRHDHEGHDHQYPDQPHQHGHDHGHGHDQNPAQGNHQEHTHGHNHPHETQDGYGTDHPHDHGRHGPGGRSSHHHHHHHSPGGMSRRHHDHGHHSQGGRSGHTHNHHHHHDHSDHDHLNYHSHDHHHDHNHQGYDQGHYNDHSSFDVHRHLEGYDVAYISDHAHYYDYYRGDFHIDLHHNQSYIHIDVHRDNSSHVHVDVFHDNETHVDIDVHPYKKSSVHSHGNHVNDSHVAFSDHHDNFHNYTAVEIHGHGILHRPCNRSVVIGGYRHRRAADNGTEGHMNDTTSMNDTTTLPPGVCTKLVSVIISFAQSYKKSRHEPVIVQCGWLNLAKCRKYKVGYEVAYRQATRIEYATVRKCCPGYMEVDGTCVPIGENTTPIATTAATTTPMANATTTPRMMTPTDFPDDYKIIVDDKIQKLVAAIIIISILLFTGFVLGACLLKVCKICKKTNKSNYV